MTAAIRPATTADAGPAGVICHAAFRSIAERHGFPPDLPSSETAVGLMEAIMARPEVHGVVADQDGRVVGSNFLWEEDEVAGVGPITVDPARQNARVGRRLMEAVLARAMRRSIGSVRLVQAAYHGRSLSLYTKLGFVAREPLTVFQGAALDLTLAGHAVRPATGADHKPAEDLYRRIHGHRRTRELAVAIAQGTAMVVERGGRLTGYTTGIGFFGHAVGETTDDLKALIAAAPAFSGPGFLVPTRNDELLRWCLEHDLRIVQPMTLMSMGAYQEPKGAFLPSVLY
jgi:predicted N-acetyltransferase YhbS